MIGIVIGHFNNLNFLELSLILLNKHHKNIKILVSDDVSTNESYLNFTDDPKNKLETICKKFNNVELLVNTQNNGHSKGDFKHLQNGIQWALKNKFKYLCKMSQRCVIDEPNLLNKLIKETELNKSTFCTYKTLRYSFFQIFQPKQLEPLVNKTITDLRGKNVEEKIKLFLEDNKIKVYTTMNKNIYHRLISTESDYNNLVSKYDLSLESKESFYIHAPCKTFRRKEV